MAKHQAFLASHRSDWLDESDLNLVEVAAREAAIDRYMARLNYDSNVEPDAETLYTTHQVIKAARIEIQDYQRKHVLYPGYDMIGLTALDHDAETKVAAGRENQIKKRRRYLSNLKMAPFSGFALVIPMLIMSLHLTQLTTLLTTPLFVLVVATILAAVMNSAEPKISSPRRRLMRLSWWSSLGRVEHR